MRINGPRINPVFSSMIRSALLAFTVTLIVSGPTPNMKPASLELSVFVSPGESDELHAVHPVQE